MTTARSVVIEKELPHAPEKVWRALTQGSLIKEWLMENDFQPVVGHSPTFALGGHFLSGRDKIPFAFNVGTAKISENAPGEDLASFLRDRSLACCW